jgi:catechol 2,3-dioxygenase-like lactoylglutathione lyase family enzyme
VATAPAVKRILETSLYVEELRRSASFYANVFGFATLVRDDRMCAMAVPGQQVLLLFVKGASATSNSSPAGLIPGHNGSGTQHLCFSISHDDLDAWTRHLIASDIELETRLDWPQGASSLYFRDPDNHSIEVGTPRLWRNDPA